MIIGDQREKVIANIKKATEAGDLNAKVELHDPVLTPVESREAIQWYLENKDTTSFRIKSKVANAITRIGTYSIQHTATICDIENAEGISGGAIVTSNHFSQLENSMIRKLARELDKPISIVSQDSNFRMPGWVGFMLKYSSTMPISHDTQFMESTFPQLLKEKLDAGHMVLMYPEQEMWFHYRKPRPCKRGAYYYAALLHVPVISCFVETREREKMDTEQFHKLTYTLHVLPTIYPDPNKTARENSIAMCEIDYAQKKDAYEKAYGVPLDYTFQASDIAGWVGEIPSDPEITVDMGKSQDTSDNAFPFPDELCGFYDEEHMTPRSVLPRK